MFCRTFARARLTNTVGVTRRYASTEALLKTVLYDDHVELGGKMVPYAGYSLPVQYKDSLINSHLHCRSSASVFDVSHMGKLRIWGDKRIDFIETLVPGDIAGLSANQARLSCLTNEQGGIIDDCMITAKNDHLYMVVNAGCKVKDVAHMQDQLLAFNANQSADVRIELLDPEWELIALQGPKAVDVLTQLVPSSVALAKLPFMFSANINVAGIDCMVTRCGYTGEDGFEIAVPAKKTKELFHKLLENKAVLPAGLGVRDSLRLEAGLSLYGHDLNEETTPVEANLSWLIGKRRREQGGFLGAEKIIDQLKNGAPRKRVGLNILGKAPAREFTEIVDQSGNKIGAVTSGTFSPCLNRPISMGYVATALSKNGTKLGVNIRGKVSEAEVVKMPFVPSNYYKPT